MAERTSSQLDLAAIEQRLDKEPDKLPRGPTGTSSGNTSLWAKITSPGQNFLVGQNLPEGLQEPLLGKLPCGPKFPCGPTGTSSGQNVKRRKLVPVNLEL